MKFLFTFFVLISAATSSSQCPIIPTPDHFSEHTGFFTFSDTLSVKADGLPAGAKDYLSMHLSKRAITLVEVDGRADIQFEAVAGKPDFSYKIHVDSNAVVSFYTPEGAFYAMNSFLQLIRNEKTIYKIPKCSIRDQPKFGWRGLHLDVSRHFFSVKEIKKFIDAMALYKFNKFHWHLTDDQGWRIEIKKFPKLTQIGAYRDSTVIGHYSDEPRKYKAQRYGGYYTQEEVRDLVAYAKQRFIEVIPEIEMPGHSRAALAAYPEFSCTGKKQEVPGLWGVFNDIYCSKEETLRFMKDVLTEVLELFPADFIHIGGDEAPKFQWEHCSACQNVMKINGLADEHELQSYFIGEIDAFLTQRGRKIIGWDEILEGGLSPNAAVMSWRGEKGGIEAAKQSHYVVMSPTTYCYFDYYQSSYDSEPLAIGGYLPLEKVYDYDPIPDEIPEEYKKFVLGGQANLWTEYMSSMDHVEYMAYPRALALIQSLWCFNKPDYRSFLKVYLRFHESYLKLNDINFARSVHYPDLKIARVEGGIELQFLGSNANETFTVKRTSMVQGIPEKVTNSNSDKHMLFSKKAHDRFELLSDQFDDTLVYDFHTTKDLGREIELITPPHPKYDHNGSLNLVDGVWSGEKFKGSEWLGFRDTIIEMIVEMNDSDFVEGLEIGFKEDNGSWIYLPHIVRVYVSDDKIQWKEILRGFDIQSGINKLNFKRSAANYFKVEIKPLDAIPFGNGGAGTLPWTFIDEIQFIRN